jgi:hypothetical protein
MEVGWGQGGCRVWTRPEGGCLCRQGHAYGLHVLRLLVLLPSWLLAAADVSVLLPLPPSQSFYRTFQNKTSHVRAVVVGYKHDASVYGELPPGGGGAGRRGGGAHRRQGFRRVFLTNITLPTKSIL